jgi:hypothetical protein
MAAIIDEAERMHVLGTETSFVDTTERTVRRWPLGFPGYTTIISMEGDAA